MFAELGGTEIRTKSAEMANLFARREPGEEKLRVIAREPIDANCTGTYSSGTWTPSGYDRSSRVVDRRRTGLVMYRHPECLSAGLLVQSVDRWRSWRFWLCGPQPDALKPPRKARLPRPPRRSR